MLNAPKTELFIGCTESSKRREKLRRDIEQETQAFLAKGNAIKPVKNNLLPKKMQKEIQE